MIDDKERTFASYLTPAARRDNRKKEGDIMKTWENITDIRLGSDLKLHFNCNGVECSMKEPRDVILDDNDASRKWIAANYNFLLP